LRFKHGSCPECGSADTSVDRKGGARSFTCRHCGFTVVRRTVRKCPSCGSTELYYEAGMITGQKYHCKRCNYIGPLVFEEDVEERKTGGGIRRT
jgi:transposase-like protein